MNERMPSAGGLFDELQLKSVFSGTSRVLDQCFDEQILISSVNNRVVWSAAGRQRVQVSCDAAVLQAGWGFFEDHPDTPSLCILHRGSLEIHHLSGIQHTVPLPDSLTSFLPLPRGIVLTDKTGIAPSILLVHPLEPLLPVFFGGCWLDPAEEIVWSCTELPMIVTYNKNEEQVTVWNVTLQETSYVVPGCQDPTSTMPDATMPENSQALVKTPKGQLKSLRLPNGNLSPIAFESVPIGGPGMRSEPGPALGNERCCLLGVLLKRHLARADAPTEGYLAEDSSGNPLLCLFSSGPGLVIAVKLDAQCMAAAWTFSVEDVAAAAVISATRGSRIIEGESRKKRDLLILHSDGRLVVYADNQSVASLNLIALSDGPWELRPLRTNEPAPHHPVVDLQHGAGDKVTLLFANGNSIRATVVMQPIGEITQAALLALERGTDHRTPMHVDEGAWSGESGLEWADLFKMVIQPLASSETGTAVSKGQCWSDLIDTDYHRGMANCYSWTQMPSSVAFRREVPEGCDTVDAERLAVLREVYEDSKLNTLNRYLLTQLRPPLPDNAPDSGGRQELRDCLENCLLGQTIPKATFAKESRTALVWECFLKIRSAITEALVLEKRTQVINVFARCGIEIANFLVDHSWTPADIDTLPCDLAVPIRQCIHACKHCPPLNWTLTGYRMIGRHDIAQNMGCAINYCVEGDSQERLIRHYYCPYDRLLLRKKLPPQNTPPAWTALQNADGMEGIDNSLTTARFGGDSRLLHVRRMLASNSPVILMASEHTDDSAESSQWQQAKLQTLATRTMTLSVGRGAFALRTHRALPTEPLCVPRLCLSAQIAERNNAVINLGMAPSSPAPGGGALAELTAWPEFHNGVAAGLRLAPGGDLTRTWIVYNRPIEPSYEHAGMLFGLGLNGHLGCLAMTDLYRYLSQEHDATVVGLLLGMSAARRCSLDPAISKMLFLHLPSRHPTGYPELEIAPLVQTAAIIGLGLLYQESGHQSIVDILTQEIGRSPGAQQSAESGRQTALQPGITRDCESYALAAGIAVGLITLGKGSKAPTNDVESRLRYYMLGGIQSGTVGRRSTLHQNCDWTNLDDLSLPTSLRLDVGDSVVRNASSSSNRTSGAVAEELAAAQGAAQVILEGDLINLNVTSPAATVALGLMYLQTNDQRGADLFHLPESSFELEFINPELLCSRIMMRALVLWDSVEPSEAWVKQQLPSILRISITDIFRRKHDKADLQAVVQAHCFCIAGACLALGIRYAGTQDKAAASSLRKFVLYFLQSKKEASEPGSSTPSLVNRATLESCVAFVATALAVVMAGSGDLETFKLLRALRKRLAAPVIGNTPPPGMNNTPTTSLTYGSYMAISMSLGFLFLGAGAFTFGRSVSAVASMVISLYPQLATATNDNRYYLQALRHLYVLAAERRNLDVLDVEYNEPASSVPLEVCTSAAAPPRNYTAPCLLPEPHLISCLSVKANLYWTQIFDSSAVDVTKLVSSSRALLIQRKLSSCAYRRPGMDVDSSSLAVYNPCIMGLKHAVCGSIPVFCRFALRDCCVVDSSLLPIYLYLYSVDRQLALKIFGHPSDASLTAPFRLLSQFYALYPWTATRGGGASEFVEGLGPVVNPTDVERWWLNAQRWAAKAR